MLIVRVLAMPIAVLAAACAAITLPGSAAAAQSDINLGTALSHAVLAGSTVTNTGPTTVSGSLGLSPGSAVTGFPPGLVSNGVIHAADAAAVQAQNDLTTAYNDAAGRSPDMDETGQNLAGQVLTTGTYAAASSMALNGTLTLDAEGDPDAVFVFQAGSTLITGSNSTVALVRGAQACHVYWQVGSSATLATGTTFVGSVLALTDITMQTGAQIQGRLLARNGQVTMDTNVITRPVCAAAPVTTPPTTSPTQTTSSAPVVPSPSVTPGSSSPATSTTSPPAPALPTTTGLPTATDQPTPTDTGAATAVPTVSGTAIAPGTATPTVSGTASATSTPTGTATATSTATATGTSSAGPGTPTAGTTRPAVVPRGFPLTGRPVVPATERTPWLVIALILLGGAVTTLSGLRGPGRSRERR